MRHISSSPGTKQTSKKRFFGSSFATKAFVATATASTTYAAYYCATVFLLGSVATVNADTAADDDEAGILFKQDTKKKDDTYGIEYVGYDSYPGIHLDDGTGVATQAEKAVSATIVAKALDAAGLDESGILKGVVTTPNGGSGDDITMHPKHVHRVGLGTCPMYGCPFLPLDVHYDEMVKAQLENMRKGSSVSSSSSDDEEDGDDKSSGSSISSGDEKDYVLNTSGSENTATLTLVGYKGGRLEDQINQDRSLALAPYLYWNINSSSSSSDSKNNDARPVARLIGAFDGHAKHGELVSEYVVKTLPALLGSKLVDYEAAAAAATNNSKDNDDDEVNTDQQQKDHDIGKILRDTFLELDATSPAEPSGGCTASMVLQIGTKLYIANAGDSRSFIAVHITPPSSSSSQAGNDGDENKSTTTIVYGTREDKPHLSTERDRVEHMGGTVYLPNGFLDTGKGTTRVLYKDPMTGSTSGLAMSRSIGDWDAGAVGVVPDPLIDILDINEIKKRVLEKLNEACNDDTTGEVEIDPASGESSSNKPQCVSYTEKDIKVFAVSATDGLLDYLPENAIANHVAKGLYGTMGGDANDEQRPSNPILASEDLIFAAAQGWQEDKGG
ncbi:hypothetical protein ACHAXR_013394, partial [Thalassiosira sp. AJA248-18]